MNRIVTRPHAPRPRGPGERRQAAQTAVEAPDIPPHPDSRGSIVCLIGLALTAAFLRGATPEDVARFGAIGSLLSLGASVAFDATGGGIRNVVRTDVMALMALYFLTLAEFLAPQIHFNEVATLQPTYVAVLACIWAYAGMVMGRHLIKPAWKHPFQPLFEQPAPGSLLFAIFWACVFVGFLYMLVSCNFNFLAMVDDFMQPRFSQPWGRGSLGDWKALLFETSEILYLVPPLGGILLARRRKYPKFQIFLVVLGVMFTFFYGFAGGTRNIFHTYLVTFLIGYCFAASRAQKNEMLILTGACVVALLISTKVMLDFRAMGLEEYVREGYYLEASHMADGQSLAVDQNLYAISRMVEYFPKHHDFTGLEIPYLAIVHPIPRALWPGKPEGMSISFEEIFGVTDETIATSMVGEEYVMHGTVAVFIMSLLAGAACAWWNLLALRKNSEFGILVYASGFFSAVITMRSLMWFSTALLPTGAGLAIGYIFLLREQRRARDQAFVRQQIGPVTRKSGV